MSSKYGFVYVLANESMPGLYKIGMTTRSPSSRAEELSSATGVPSDFCVVYYAEFEAPYEVEAFIHSELSEFRSSFSREFFRAPLDKIADFVDSICPISGWHGDEVAFARHQLKNKRFQVVS